MGISIGRVGLGVLAAVFALAMWPAISQGVVLTPTSAPLPESNFQGGDGNQDDEAPYVDWQSIAGSANLFTINDATGPTDDIFLQGKEGSPVDWDLGVGSANPTKADILNSWSYIEGPFLYQAFGRLVNQGSTFVGLEFNRDPREWRNANGDLIPCRTDGDLIISYEITGGDKVEILTQEWNAISAVTTEEAAAGFTNGVGCSKTGEFIETDPGAANAQAAMNAVAITNYLPAAPAVAAFEPGLFGEAALRMGVIAPQTADGCWDFRQANLHTRTSRTSSSTLVDYTQSVDLCQLAQDISADAKKRRCGKERPTIRGTKFGETIVGTPGPDVIKGRGGDDVIHGKGGRDLICPNRGHDKARGGIGNDTVRGGPNNDRLNGGKGEDFVHGFKGDDTVNGGPDKDRCMGGTGNNIRISCEGR